MECFIKIWNDTFKHQLFDLKFCCNAKIKANIYFCASPFETKQRSIKFTSCNKTLPTLSNDIITKLTNKTTISSLNFEPEKITTYYVGQGNFSKITCKGEKEIIFDIGLSTFEPHTNFKNSIDEIAKVNPEYIIISHLDIDHFLGVQYLDSGIFDSANWIISIHGNLTQSALRLIAYINSKNKNNLYLYDNCGQQLITGIVSLYQGTGQKILTCNSKNNGGLILKIKHNDKTALLPGDCIYDAMPRCLEGDYNFLLVPHHCCKILQNSNISNFLPKYNGEQAVISYGKNPYGHPNPNHMAQLALQNFEVSLTYEKIDPIVFEF